MNHSEENSKKPHFLAFLTELGGIRGDYKLFKKFEKFQYVGII